MGARDGRGRVAVKKPVPLVFTLPFSGDEILLLGDQHEYVGVAYNPGRMSSPIPWSAACAHCRGGQQAGLGLSVKQAIKVLCSRRIVDDVEMYSVPTNKDPCELLCDRKGDELVFLALFPGREAVKLPWKGDRLIGPKSDLPSRSKILERALKVLASIEPVSKREAAAILKPLLEGQKRGGIDVRRRHPCLKIDWASLI